MSVKSALLCAVLLVGGCAPTLDPTALPAHAYPDAAPQRAAWAATCADADEWDTPGPPVRMYGNSYYVGTCGIAAILVDEPGNLTLIDTGTDAGADVVLANIRALGFDPRNVRTILMTHEHFDHVGGMAKVQAATGATIYATAPAAAVLRSGKPGADDPQAGSEHPPFPPVTGPVTVIDGSRPVGRLTPILTPGHTTGALSWRWQACEGDTCKWIVYADSMNPISSDDYRFSDHPALVDAFRMGIAALGAAPCDIVVTPHPVASDWRNRMLGTKPLVDSGGCRAYAASVTGRLDARLAKEAAGG